MPTVVNGLPAHILLVHVMVVLVPVSAVLVVVSAAWPAARRRLGVLPAALALGALVLLPVTVHAGHWLQQRLRAMGNTGPAIQRHVNLGNSFWPYVAALFVVAVAVWWLGRRDDRLAEHEERATDEAAGPVYVKSADTGTAAVLQQRRASTPTWIAAVVTAVAVAVAVASLLEVYRVGDSGSRAVWQYTTGPSASAAK